MKVLTKFYYYLIFYLYCEFIRHSTSQKFDNRIFNAKIVSFEKSKFFVTIINPHWLFADDVFCGGAVIRPKWVISAAHCFEFEDIGDIKIGYGATKVDNLVQYDVSFVVMHQNYRNQGNNISEGDIALAKLEREIPVAFEDLPVLNYDRLPEGSTGFYYSFGGYEGKENLGVFSSNLRFARIKTTEFDCNTIVDSDHLKFLCWTHIGPTAAAKGDSGSPIVFANDTILGGLLVQRYKVQLASGKEIEQNRGPRISYYYFWIKHVMYFEERTKNPSQKKLFCCKQESIEQYCIKKVKYRQFASVEVFPILNNIQENSDTNSCSFINT